MSMEGGGGAALDEAEVESLVQDLYGLKHFGQMLENVKNGIAEAHQATYREHPYRIARVHHPVPRGGRHYGQHNPPPRAHTQGGRGYDSYPGNSSGGGGGQSYGTYGGSGGRARKHSGRGGN